MAGDGIQSFGGDGGPATSAQLNFPTGITVDASGNLYIADLFNGRIRKVTSQGIIITVAGNSTVSSIGDGFPATANALSPNGIAVDALGDVLFSNNDEVRELVPAPTSTVGCTYSLDQSS